MTKFEKTFIAASLVVVFAIIGYTLWMGFPVLKDAFDISFVDCVVVSCDDTSTVVETNDGEQYALYTNHRYPEGKTVKCIFYNGNSELIWTF